MSLFESAFGIFKSFVKGSRNEASQMVERFIRFQCFPSHRRNSPPREDHVTTHGKITSISEEILSTYGLDAPDIDGEVGKVSMKHQMFTSCNYSRKGNSASYYATSVVQQKTVFLRIDHIVIDKHNKVLCLCSSFADSVFLSDFNSIYVPTDVLTILKNNFPLRLLRHSAQIVLPADKLVSHFIAHETPDRLYGIPVLNNLEHD